MPYSEYYLIFIYNPSKYLITQNSIALIIKPHSRSLNFNCIPFF